MLTRVLKHPKLLLLCAFLLASFAARFHERVGASLATQRPLGQTRGKLCDFFLTEPQLAFPRPLGERGRVRGNSLSSQSSQLVRHSFSGGGSSQRKSEGRGAETRNWKRLSDSFHDSATLRLLRD